MRTWTYDLLQAVRFLRRRRGFTAAATLTFAVGIAANATIFSLADATFRRLLSVPDAERIVHVYQRRSDEGPYPMSLADFAYYRAHSTSFEALAAHYPTAPLHVLVDGRPLEINGAVVTASYADVLQLRPALGRWFTADEDDVRGRDAVAVISESLWTRQFERDLRVLGRALHINGRAFTIVGVAPEGFKGVRSRTVDTDIWIPSAMFSTGYRYCDAFERECRIVQLTGKLRVGVSSLQAQRELDVLARQLETAVPVKNPARGVSVVPARGLGLGSLPAENEQMSIFLAAAACLLLIACGNIAGLLLAAGSTRRKEIAVRFAVGATRSRVVRLLLTESGLLALFGGALGLLLAVWSNEVVEGFYARSNSGLPVNFELALTPIVIFGVTAVSAAAALISGLVPALRTARFHPGAVLKDEAPSGGAARARLRQMLVAGQVAVSLMLVVAAGLLVQSLSRLMAGPGFDPGPVAMVRLRPSLVDYSYERSHDYQRRVIEAVSTLPGVVSAAPSEFLSIMGAGRAVSVAPAVEPVRQFTGVGASHVGAGYFATLGVQLIEGREFNARDTLRAPSVAVVNDVLARRIWPDTSNVVGQSLLVQGKRHEIVGVVRDAQYYNAGDTPRPQIFLSYWQPDLNDPFGKDARLCVRVGGDATDMIAAIERIAAAVDPNVPVSEAYPLVERVAYAYQPVRTARTLLVTLGLVSLLLTAIGLYGVLTFAVHSRIREIAIRIALGAASRDVARLVFRQGAALALTGVAAGLAGAWLSVRLMSGLLYGVQTHDVLTFAVAPLLVIAIALAATYLPAHQAAAVSPIEALNRE